MYVICSVHIRKKTFILRTYKNLYIHIEIYIYTKHINIMAQYGAIYSTTYYNILFIKENIICMGRFEAYFCQ